MSRNRVIGRDGKLPWHMPADLRRFKQRTTGHAVIMGRKTWDTLNGRPLPGRANIVVTRDAAFSAEGVIVVHSMDGAIDAARRERPDADEIFVAGGAEIYRLALPMADRIDLTVIDMDVIDGDAHFPPFEHDSRWRLQREERHPADDRQAVGLVFCEYQRLPTPTAC